MYLKDYVWILKKNIFYFLTVFAITIVVYIGFYLTRPIVSKASCSIISKQIISDITLQIISGIPLVGESDTTPHQRLQKIYNRSFLTTVNKFANVLIKEKPDMEKLGDNFAYYQTVVEKMNNFEDFLQNVNYRAFLRGTNEIAIEVAMEKKGDEPLYICAGFCLAFLQDGFNDANTGFKKQLEYYKGQYEKAQQKLKSIRDIIPFDYITRQEDLKALEAIKNNLQEHIDDAKKEFNNYTKTRTILLNLINNGYPVEHFFDDFASSKTKELKANLDSTKATLQSELVFKNTEHPEIKKLFVKINSLQDAIFKSFRQDILNNVNKINEELQNLQNEIVDSTNKLHIFQDKIERIKTSLANAKIYIKEEEQLSRQIEIIIENINKYKTLLELNKSFVNIYNPPRLISTSAFSFGRYLPIILLLGCVLGFLVVYLVEYLETNIVSEVDVKKYLGYECIGIVPLERGGREELILLHKNEQLSLAIGEIFKAISSIVVKKMSDIKSNCFIVSGIGRYEGKTTCCINLSYILANVGYKCALLDMDFRTKNLTYKLNKYFGSTATIHENIDYIEIEWNLEEILKKITQGEFEELLGNLKTKYDFIIIDAPPIMSVGETPFMMKKVNNLVLILASGEVSKAKSRWFKHVMHTLDINVVGVILNKSPLEIAPTYYYYKYGYYKK